MLKNRIEIHFKNENIFLKQACSSTTHLQQLQTLQEGLQGVLMENISPQERRNKTLSCRITLLRQRLSWIAGQSENTTQNLGGKKKVKLKYLY